MVGRIQRRRETRHVGSVPVPGLRCLHRAQFASKLAHPVIRTGSLTLPSPCWWARTAVKLQEGRRLERLELDECLSGPESFAPQMVWAGHTSRLPAEQR